MFSNSLINNGLTSKNMRLLIDSMHISKKDTILFKINFLIWST